MNHRVTSYKFGSKISSRLQFTSYLVTNYEVTFLFIGESHQKIFKLDSFTILN